MNYSWQSCELAGKMLPGHEGRDIGPLDTRLTPPSDVFCYAQPDLWLDDIWLLLSDHITDSVKDAFIAKPPKNIFSDDLGWLEKVIRKVTGERVDIKTVLADRLTSGYRALRAAHGTRTNDLSSFYENGLLVLRLEDIEQRAHQIFVQERGDPTAEDRLQSAITDLDEHRASGVRIGRLYFCAKESNLIERNGGGHYLIYGSEYLFCLGMRVSSKRDAKERLKTIGRPTVFICDIPMAMVSPGTIREFSGIILEYMFLDLIGAADQSFLASRGGSAFSLRRDLASEHIVGHYHPTTIWDQHARL